jgi:hypothetical protein
MNLFYRLLDWWDNAVDARPTDEFYRQLRRCAGQERARRSTQQQLRMRRNA